MASVNDALRAAGGADLPPNARAWLRQRVRQYGYAPEARNVGGLRCTWPHKHTSPSGCVEVRRPDGSTRRLATFTTVEEGAQALVLTARRAGATPGEPAETLEGFRSIHLGAVDAATLAARFRAVAGDWEAFERAGARDPRWQRYRDAWLSGSASVAGLVAGLEEQEALADATRARLAHASGVGGLSDAAYKEFGYLDRREKRFRDFVFERCGNKRKPTAPPCPLTESQLKNFGDFGARWINFAGDVNSWAVNKDSIFGTTVDESAIQGWRAEFDQWEKILHAAGFEADLAQAPTPKPPDYTPPAGGPPGPWGLPLGQIKTVAIGVAAAIGLVAVASVARSVASLFGR